MGLSDRSNFNFFCFINTSGQDVLQRLVEFTQYVSIRYSERLAEAGIEPSVGSTGDSYDNALAGLDPLARTGWDLILKSGR